MRRMLAAGLPLVLAASVHAQPVVAADAEAMRNYAHVLARRGEFRAAAMELDRLLVYHPAAPGREGLVDEMLGFASRSEDSTFAASLAAEVEQKASAPSERCLGRYHRGRALYRQDRHDGALAALALPDTCPETVREDALFYSGLSLLRARRWHEARTSFDALGPAFRFPERKSRAQDAARDAAATPYREPSTAGGLSAVFPGAGYWYAGSPQSALAALLTTGLLGWAAASSFRSGNTGLGVLSGTLGFGWHLGGAYGSARAAHRYNKALDDHRIGILEFE